MATENRNRAFIDAQNLYLGTTKAEYPWKVNLDRFRIYLREKYHVDKAYYFIGAYYEEQSELYKSIQEFGYILIFREHGIKMMGSKKGNVDTDIVFSIMKKLVDDEDFDRVLLVSGDGDYYRMVDYLIKKERFEKLLAPSKSGMSSLYKRTPDRMWAFLDDKGTRQKIEYTNWNK
jgi:uncharacterized LabA/DUF88 family protein